MQENSTRPARSTSSQAQPSIAVLWQAIEASALERQHRPADVARYVGLHAAHYYRLRKSPSQLARCHPDVLRRLAEYVYWTVLDVYVGVGLIDPGDLWTSPRSSHVLRDALKKLAASRFASGIVTPIDCAAEDHQLLIARLHVAVLSEAIA